MSPHVGCVLGVPEGSVILSTHPQCCFTFRTFVTPGLNAAKPPREVLGVLLPGMKKYFHATLEFLDNTGTYFNPLFPWGKTILFEGVTPFPPLPST